MDLLERVRALAATAVLGDVAAPTLIALAERAAVIELEAGATITTRRPDEVVVVVVAHGVLEVEVGDAHGDARARVGAGELLGAAGALDAEAPAVTARAVEPSVVLELGQDDFIDVLAEHPVASRALARELAAALREARR
jgi:CRP-like cAMP-binding protein